MADPQSPVSQVVSSNEEIENDGSLSSYESTTDPCHLLKGSNLLAHRTRITYQKMRYMSIRN
jgi:hypothetical protein